MPAAARGTGVRVLQRTAGNRAVGQLLRQVVAPREPQVQSVAPGADANQLRVVLDDGSRYRVTRRVRARNAIEPGRPRFGLCHDDKRVFARVAWCRGTRGRIDVGANPQGALEELLDEVGKEIARGGGLDAVKRTVADAKLQPFAEVDIARNESWRVTGDIKLDVNKAGLLGASAGVTFDNGWFKVRLAGEATDLQGQEGRQPGGQGTVKIEVPLPGEPPRVEACPPIVAEFLWEYSCVRERDTEIVIQPPPRHRRQDDRVRLYFDYETADLRRDASGPGEANTAALAELDRLMNAGHRVTAIDGYTSPEGSSAPPTAPSAAGHRFQGNQTLSEARATAVRDDLRRRCSPLRMRPCVDDEVKPTGRGELFSSSHTAKVGGVETEREDEGSVLDRKVVPAFTADPAELNRLTSADRKLVEDPRAGTRRRAAKLYEYLRRADVQLLREWDEPTQPVRIPDVAFDPVPACPAVVEAAAERQWGPRIPYTPGEKSVCR